MLLFLTKNNEQFLYGVTFKEISPQTHTINSANSENGDLQFRWNKYITCIFKKVCNAKLGILSLKNR